jgi:hypothetical protein
VHAEILSSRRISGETAYIRVPDAIAATRRRLPRLALFLAHARRPVLRFQDFSDTGYP